MRWMWFGNDLFEIVVQIILFKLESIGIVCLVFYLFYYFIFAELDLPPKSFCTAILPQFYSAQSLEVMDNKNKKKNKRL